MGEISKVFYLLGLVFLLLGLMFNISPSWPRLPWDIYLDRPGFKIYIPWATALIISVILTIFLNFFRR